MPRKTRKNPPNPRTGITSGDQRKLYRQLVVEMGPRWDVVPPTISVRRLKALVGYGLAEVLEGPTRYARLTPLGVEFRDYWIRVSAMREAKRRGMTSRAATDS